MTSSSQEELPWELDVHSVRQLLDTGQLDTGQLDKGQPGLLLLDCREIEEYERVHLDGARLIPMQEIPQRLDELEPHRGSRIVVYCHHGFRSMQVTQWLRQQGFLGAQNMAGGIDAWSCWIDPTKPRYQ